MRTILRLRKDNRGDTLVIVLVGIFLLGLLGSAILASTAMNYQMKSIDRGNKKNFYTAEQALDEVYAGVGADVMNSMQFAYTYVLDNMLIKDPVTGKYNTTDNDELNKIFRNIYFYALTGRDPIDENKATNWDTIKAGLNVFDNTKKPYAIYQNEPTKRSELSSYLNNFVASLGSGTHTPVVTIPATSDLDPVAVLYSTKDVTNAAGNFITIETFTLKNVTVTYTSDQDVTSRVSTDITVEVPIVDINFSEVTTIDYTELLKYSIVAEGDESPAKLDVPVMSVKNNLEVNGSIYAGAIESEKKVGIKLDGSIAGGVDLNVTGSNVVTSGDFNLYNGRFTLNRGLTDSTLRFWAKNIITTGENDVVMLDNADCILKDDLQIDGNNSEVTISGNYFGVGYRDSGTGSEADSEEHDYLYFTEDGSSAFDVNGNIVSNTDGYEHEDSSAIIVNGKGASVNLTGLRNMVLAGRAYVDLLDLGNNDGRSTYMTGESISIKGSQNAYLAELSTEYFNNDSSGNPVVLTNPIAYSLFQGKVRDNNILTNKTIAKKVGDSVYFYRNSSNPIDQTNIFEEYFNTTRNKRELREKVDDLEVRELLLGNDTNIMSVGALLNIDHSKAETQSVLVRNHNVEGGNVIGGVAGKSFSNYVSDCNVRFHALLTELHDYPESIETFSVSSTAIDGILNSTNTPMVKYVNAENFNKIFDFTLPELDVTKVIGAEHYENELDITSSGLFGGENGSPTDYNITDLFARIVITKRPTYEITGDFDCGVIISQGDVIIRSDFAGIIICEGDIIVDNGGVGTIELNAYPDLVRWLADNDTTFAQCLSGYLAVSESGDGDATGHVTINNIEYKDLVSYNNWKKLSPNAS